MLAQHGETGGRRNFGSCRQSAFGDFISSGCPCPPCHESRNPFINTRRRPAACLEPVQCDVALFCSNIAVCLTLGVWHRYSAAAADHHGRADCSAAGACRTRAWLTRRSARPLSRKAAKADKRGPAFFWLLASFFKRGPELFTAAQVP